MRGERGAKTGPSRLGSRSHHVVRVDRHADRQGDEHRAERKDDLPDGSRASHTGSKSRPVRSVTATGRLARAGPLHTLSLA